MPATEATIQLAQFYAKIRPLLDADTAPRLAQSINGWISYYQSLQVLRGGYSPSATLYMREQFYPLATTLLDHIADTVCHFFALPWPCAEIPHARLTRLFPGLCTEKRLQGDVAGLHAAMRDLHARIVVPGKTGPASPAEGGAPHGTPAPQAHLQELLLGIDHYM
jgi:hypothetical protein